MKDIRLGNYFEFVTGRGTAFRKMGFLFGAMGECRPKNKAGNEETE